MFGIFLRFDIKDFVLLCLLVVFCVFLDVFLWNFWFFIIFGFEIVLFIVG